MPRYFTPEEARAALPFVRALLLEARAQQRRLDDLRVTLADAALTVMGNGHLESNGANGGQPEIERVAESLSLTLRRIEATGCIVKDVASGLVDWPWLRDGREVYLCWRLGEPDLLYWHEVADGFTGRQLL